MSVELKEKIVKWLKSFPLALKTVMKRFRKGDSKLHIIRLCDSDDTIKLWIKEYPSYCLKFIKAHTSDDEYIDLIQDYHVNYETYDDPESEDSDDSDASEDTYEKQEQKLIESDFLEYILITKQYGDMLPDTLFDAKKDDILVGDIVFAPDYETRLYYGVRLAYLGKDNIDIITIANEGHRPMIQEWQQTIMNYNKLSFAKCLNSLEPEHGDIYSQTFLEIWEECMAPDF